MKELTPQILAMYLGCECQYTDNDNLPDESALMAINIGGYAFMMEPDEEEPIEIKNVKPILRRLSSMTEEEARELFINKWPEPEYQARFSNITVGLLAADNSRPIRFDWTSENTGGKLVNNLGTLSFNSFSPNQWQWLLSKHFDLFNLIDNNLAVRNSHEETNLPNHRPRL